MKCKKLKYGEETAKKEAKRIRKQAKKVFGHTDRQEKRAYKCPICGSWHLTKISQGEWIIIERRAKKKFRNARIDRDKEIWQLIQSYSQTN